MQSHLGFFRKLFFLFVLFGFRANAVIPCPYSPVSQFRNFENLRSNARWIKDHEPHTDPKEVINGVVAKKFLAATGTIICGGKPSGSANVVCGGKVLVTAGHLFHNPPESCNFTTAPESCSFRTSTAKGDIDIPIEKLQKMGTKCSVGNVPDMNSDWAVATLTKPVANNPSDALHSVEPYSLGKSENVKIGQPLIGACSESADVIARDKVSQKLARPKVWSFGSKEEEFSDGINKDLWSTSISASFGCSGGGLVNKDHELVAIGIYSGEQIAELTQLMTRPDLNYHAAACTYTPDGNCKTYWLPVQGEFAAAVQDACAIPAK